MTDERWPRVKALFQAAVERPPEERHAFLAALTGDDDALRREVESLLASDASDVGFLDQLPIASESVRADPLAALSAAMDHTRSHTVLTAGHRVGPYEVVGPLGAGGMGEVYRARDTKLNRDVALKVLPELFALDPDRLARFTREARMLATLNHPNIAAIYGLEESNPSPGSGQAAAQALVLELVEGPTLADRIALGPIALEEALTIARQVAEALEAAHGKGIIHRDLKPENVMVRADGYVKVLDFGLAKWLPTTAQLQAERATMEVSQPGQILGTVAYMSPEQIQGQDVDQRSDLFAFGILLYEMLTGRHPWPRPSAVETLHAILHDDPPPIDASPHVGPDLATVVRTLLRKHPAERYPTAEAALEALATPAAARESSTPSWASPKLLTSIAVLPFVFLSDVEDSRALSLGFADALITIFGNLEDVIVAPTSAILNYAAGTEPARSAAISASVTPCRERSRNSGPLARLDSAVRCDDAQDHAVRET